jgi:hypothetical protein
MRIAQGKNPESVRGEERGVLTFWIYDKSSSGDLRRDVKILEIILLGYNHQWWFTEKRMLLTGGC